MSDNDLSVYELSPSLHDALGVVTIAPISLTELSQAQDGYVAERHLQGQIKKEQVKAKNSSQEQHSNNSLVLPEDLSLSLTAPHSASQSNMASLASKESTTTKLNQVDKSYTVSAIDQLSEPCGADKSCVPCLVDEPDAGDKTCSHGVADEHGGADKARLDGVGDGAVREPLGAGREPDLQLEAKLSAPYEMATKLEGNEPYLEATTIPSSANIVLDKFLHQVNEESSSHYESEDVLSTVLGLEEHFHYEEPSSTDTTVKLDKDEAPSTVDEGVELSAEDLERFSKLSLKEGDTCPACSKGTLVLRKNDKVQFLGCSCYPSCKMRYFTALSSPVSNLKILKSLCPNCNSPLAVKKGRYGLFVGCSNYPDCNYTHKESETEQYIKCPICNKGTLEKRRAKNGRTFYGCNNYPECKFLVSGVPVLRSCKECCFPLSFKKKVKAGIALVCANPLCSSRRKRKYELIESNS